MHPDCVATTSSTRRSIGVYPRQDRFLYSFNEDYRVRMGRQPLG
jgi:hypothetical protein